MVHITNIEKFKRKATYFKHKGKIEFYLGVGKACSCGCCFANNVDLKHHKKVCGSIPKMADSFEEYKQKRNLK